MNNRRVLVVDDEEDIQKLVKYNLTKEGFQVTCVGNGEEGIALARKEQPALIVLDLMLPGLDGLDVCRVLKSDPRTKHIAIVMLTAKSDDIDMVSGLEIGADDYIVKPFSPRVLTARLKSVLRRGQEKKTEGAVVDVSGLTINVERHEVLIKGKQLKLTHNEFRLLHLLASNPGVVYSRYQIVDKIHGSDYPVTDRSVDVQIVGLRRKLGFFGERIETVRGVGYRFQDPSDP